RAGGEHERGQSREEESAHVANLALLEPRRSRNGPGGRENRRPTNRVGVSARQARLTAPAWKLVAQRLISTATPMVRLRSHTVFRNPAWFSVRPAGPRSASVGLSRP